MAFTWGAIADSRGDRCVIASNRGVYVRLEIASRRASGKLRWPFFGFDGCISLSGAGQRMSDECMYLAMPGWGIACADIRSMKEIWRRVDIDDVYHVAVSGQGCVLAARQSDGAVSWTALDATSGKDLTAPPIDRGSFCWMWPGQERACITGGGLQIVDLGKWAIVREWEKVRGQVLCVAFGTGRVFVSEAFGRIVCLDVASGRRVWLSEGGEASHCIRMCAVEERGVVLAVGTDERNGRGEELMAFDLDTGQRRGLQRPKIPDGRSHNGVFLEGGHTILLNDGYIVDVFSGAAEAIDCEGILRAAE